MAYRADNESTVRNLALGLLALCAAVHYGWMLVPSEHQADAWNIAGAFGRTALLIAFIAPYRNWRLWGIAFFWLAEEAMVMGCSAWYIVAPWPIAPGMAQCSSLLSFDLGKVGAAILALLLMLAMRRD